MNWDDLRFFLAIADAGHLAGAARTLGVNHSTVFRRLNALESTLGARLFDRLPDGYVLTDAGEAIHRHAASAQAAVHALERTALGADYELTGLVRLTAPPNLAIDYVARALPAFEDAYPGIRVELVVSDSDFDLGRREADIALRATTRPPEHLVGRRLMRVPWLVFGSEAYVARHGRPADMTDLAGHRFVNCDDRFLRLAVFRWMRETFEPQQFVHAANDLTTMAAIAVAGLGLAILPCDQVRPDLEPLFPVDPAFASDLWLLTHPDLRKVARIRATVDFLGERLAEDARLTQWALA